MTEFEYWDCPTCDDITAHETLAMSPNSVTLQCQDCKGVHKETPKRAKITTIPLHVSVEETTIHDQIVVPTLEEISVGDEFEHNDHRMMVTALQTAAHERVRKATAHELQLIHAKLFDTVRLKCSINRNDITKSEEFPVSPEHEVHIGMVIELPSGERGVVKTIKSDQNRTINRGFLLARSIVRVFMDPAPERAKRGQRLWVRRRGLPEGARSTGPSKRIKGRRSLGSRRG